MLFLKMGIENISNNTIVTFKKKIFQHTKAKNHLHGLFTIQLTYSF